ncbi:DDE superfamily endonuclease [Popillia japonica]|uniref:DDE superfamily endonuclease n=1 Tax=Popillia japonica TaxID=7064 RepID=A0AAW1JC36_POPJA
MAFPYIQFLAVQLGEREDRRRARRNLTLVRRNLRDTQDPFSVTDIEFMRCYRLNKDACQDLIAQVEVVMINEDVIKKIPPFITVLCALSFFASGSYQRGVGYSLMNAVSQATVL